MQLLQKGQAGTMQSSDLLVVVEPADTLGIEIESTVKKQYEHLIRARLELVLARHQVTQGHIRVTDRGALDYAIEARLETALCRSVGKVDLTDMAGAAGSAAQVTMQVTPKSGDN